MKPGDPMARAWEIDKALRDIYAAIRDHVPVAKAVEPLLGLARLAEAAGESGLAAAGAADYYAAMAKRIREML
jgi:hypothetical protein